MRKGRADLKTQNQRLFVASSSHQNVFACCICKQRHSVYKCQQFLSLPINKRKEKVIALKLCGNCLKTSHSISDCSSGHCKYCNEKHHSLLHESPRTVTDQSQSKSQHCLVSEQESGDAESRERTATATSCNLSATSQVLLSTAQVQVRDAEGNIHTCKALLDSASMSNFVSQNLVDRLGLSLHNIQYSVIGIGQTQSNLHYACEIQVKSNHFDFNKELRCLVISKITDRLPGTSFDPSLIKIPSHLLLADSTFHESSEIDLLIGADTFWEIMSKGTIYLGRNKPVAQKTKLGFIISDPLGSSCPSKSVTCNFSRQFEQGLTIQEQLARFWEIEEISSKPLLSSEEALTEEHFINTFKRDEAGRLIVSIPLKEPITKLGDSKENVRKQFFCLERRLNSNPELKQMYISKVHV